jgi:hypothetical protein
VSGSGAPSEKPSGPRHGRYTIYKPLRSGKGAALQFELNPDTPAIFVEGAHQEPGEQKRFAWSKKIVMKWSLADIGQALAVLERRQVQAKLFHQTQKGNSVFELRYNADRDPPDYFVMLSRQLADTKEDAPRRAGPT